MDHDPILITTAIDAGRASLNTLPNEIVVEIVCYHQAQLSLKPFAWVGATHVCRYWRAVALATPILWTTIVVREDTRPAAIAAFLERSGCANLAVVSEIPPDRPHGSCALLESVVRGHAARIVRHVGCSSVVAARQDERERAVFPVLEHLDVCAHGTARDGERELLALDCGAARFPSLRSLRLEGMLSPASTLLARSIVDLELVCLPGRDASLDALLDLLEPLALLEILTIQLYLPYADARRTVSLNRLRQLNLRAESFNVWSLISHLAFPASTSVHASVALPYAWYASMVPTVTPRAHLSPLAPILASVEGVSLHISRSSFELDTHAPAQAQAHGRSRFRLHARCPGAGAIAVSCGRKLLSRELGQVLALTRATALRLSSDGELEPDAVEVLLAGCPDLRHLAASYAGVEIPLLCRDGVRFPELETFTLFPAGTGAGEAVPAHLRRTVALSCVLRVAKLCRLRGTVLERVTIQTADDAAEWAGDSGVKRTLEEVRENVGVLGFEKSQSRTSTLQNRQ